MSSEKSSDSFASLFEAETRGQKPQQKSRLPALGDRVRAEVVQVGKEAVFVELTQTGPGKRAQAYLDLQDLKDADGQSALKVGDSLEAVVVAINGGEIRLGRTMGRPQGLAELENAHAARVPVEGKVTGVNKGGLEVEVAGVRAFCPISQADRGFVQNPQELVGRALLFVVTEVREGGKRVVLSRRAALEQESRARSAETLAKLTVGAVLSGSVTAIREFGAFVDLGGVEGLIPNQELSHDRGARAEGLLSPGDAVEVQIREIKDGVDKRGEKTTKITLSLKALAADPWDNIAAVAPVGKVVRGSVTRLADFGAFVRIAAGVEGLLHVSELGGGKSAHPASSLKVGDTMTVVVRNVDAAARKISLAPAPEGLEVGSEARGPSLSIGTIVNGTVERVEPYGVFLQVDGTRGRVGRGLIPNAELGTPRGSDTRKLFPLGTKLTAKVLETGEGKLKLSISAIKADEERADFDGFRAQSAQSSKLGTLADLLKKK